MPTTTRAALPSPPGSQPNDVVADMALLAQAVDDAMAMASQGLIAGRPAATKQRRLYWASDDRGGKLHYDDGGAWHEIGPGPVAGPQSGYTGLITSAASAALADVTLSARAKASQTGDIFRVESATPVSLLTVDVNGNLRASNGTATAPSHSFLNNTDMGLYRPAAGVLASVVPTSGWFSWRNSAGSEVAKMTDSGGMIAQYVSLGSGLPVGTSPIYVNAPSGLTAQLMNLQKNSVTQAQIDSQGNLSAIGNDTYLGPYALNTGTGVSRWHFLTDAANVHAWAEGDGADRGIVWRSKGAGNFTWQTGASATLMQMNSVGNLSFSQNPGTTHESQRSPGMAQMIGARGFGVSNDSAAYQGGVTAGISVAINRSDPAISVYNAGGDSLRLYGASAALKASVSSGGLASLGDVAGFSWGAASTARIRTLSGSTGEALWLETPSGKSALAQYQIGLRNYDNGVFEWAIGQRTSDGHLAISSWDGGSLAERLTLTQGGSVSAGGNDHYFGSGATNSGTGNKVHLYGPLSGSGYALVEAQGGTDTNVALVLAGKGVGSLIWQGSSGSTQWAITNTGVTQAPAADHYFGTASLGATGKRLHLLTDATWSRIYGEDQTGSSANGNLWVEAGSIYNQIANASGEWRLNNNSGAQVAGFTIGGTLKAIGVDQYLGAYALGGTGNRLYVNALTTGAVTTLEAQNSAGSTTSLLLKSNGTLAGSGISMQNSTLGEMGRFEAVFTMPAKTTNLYVMRTQNGAGLNQTLQQVTLGVADSGGTGYSVLRVPN